MNPLTFPIQIIGNDYIIIFNEHQDFRAKTIKSNSPSYKKVNFRKQYKFITWSIELQNLPDLCIIYAYYELTEIN